MFSNGLLILKRELEDEKGDLPFGEFVEGIVGFEFHCVELG
jgi:hypothetical protein